MIYTLVDSDGKFEAAFGPLSEYPAEIGGDAVRVSSGYPPDFVRFLVGRVLFDYHDACGGGRYRNIGTLRLAEVLRDFYGFEVLGPGAGGEGMVVDLGQMYSRFWGQEHDLARCMHVFDRDGLRERLAEISRSEQGAADEVEKEPYVLEIDGYAHIVNGKLICFRPGTYDLNDPAHREKLFGIAAVLYEKGQFLPAHGKDTVYFADEECFGHFLHLPLSTQDAIRKCGHAYYVPRVKALAPAPVLDLTAVPDRPCPANPSPMA